MALLVDQLAPAVLGGLLRGFHRARSVEQRSDQCVIGIGHWTPFLEEFERSRTGGHSKLRPWFCDSGGVCGSASKCPRHRTASCWIPPPASKATGALDDGYEPPLADGHV